MLRLPVALTIPVETLPPVILPVAEITPATYAPVDANTRTLLVAPMLAAILPPLVVTLKLLVPSFMLATDVIMPVR